MKTVYITGANGFIGQNLVNYLSDQGYLIHVLLRDQSIPKFNLHKNISIHYGDLLDKKSLLVSIPSGSVIINLAANPYHPQLSFRVNVQGVENLLAASHQKKVLKFIQISTQATKIRKKGVYAKSKQQADDLVSKSGLSFIILKPSLVYGLGDEGLFNKLQKILGQSILLPIFGKGDKKLYPIFVTDLCFFIKKIIDDSNLVNKTFDLGSAKAISYNNFYKKIIAVFNFETKIIHLPVFLGLALSSLFKFIPNPPFKIDHVLGSTQDINCDPNPLIKRYKYLPLNFDQGLKKISGTERLNVAIIGLGKMGMLHASILKTFSDVNLTTIIEKDKKLAPTIKSMLNIKSVYTNINQALKKEKINALFITTPTFTHLDLIKAALKFKVHLFVEKPVCLNFTDLQFVKKIPHRQNIYAGYTLLFNRTFNKVKKIIDGREYGKIESFEGFCKHSEVLTPLKGWPYQKNKSGGGVLMNPGPHLFSLVNWYFGKPVSQSSSIFSIYSKEVEDRAIIKLGFRGFDGKLTLNWSVKNELRSKTYLIIHFQKANIWVDDEKIIIKGKNFKKTIHQNQLPAIVDPIFNLNPQSNGESYFTEDRLFIDSIKTKIKPPNNLNFAIQTEETILNSYNQNDQ